MIVWVVLQAFKLQEDHDFRSMHHDSAFQLFGVFSAEKKARDYIDGGLDQSYAIGSYENYEGVKVNYAHGEYAGLEMWYVYFPLEVDELSD